MLRRSSFFPVVWFLFIGGKFEANLTKLFVALLTNMALEILAWTSFLQNGATPKTRHITRTGVGPLKRKTGLSPFVQVLCLFLGGQQL